MITECKNLLKVVQKHIKIKWIRERKIKKCKGDDIEKRKIMILGKIIRSGGLVASGVLLGSLLSYNSEKTEIFSGIESLKTSAIEAKSNEAKILEQKKK